MKEASRQCALSDDGRRGLALDTRWKDDFGGGLGEASGKSAHGPREEALGERARRKLKRGITIKDEMQERRALTKRYRSNVSFPNRTSSPRKVSRFADFWRQCVVVPLTLSTSIPPCYAIPNSGESSGAEVVCGQPAGGPETGKIVRSGLSASRKTRIARLQNGRGCMRR